MANKIKPESYTTVILKNSVRQGKMPSPGDLEIGEIALSLYKGEESIWAKNSEGEVVKLNSVTKESLWDRNFGVFKSYSVYQDFLDDLESGSVTNENIVFVSEPENRGIWTQGTFYYSTFDPDEYYTKEQADEKFLTQEAGQDFITMDDVATDEQNGVMSARDKARLDAAYDGDPQLVIPQVLGEWNIYDNNGTFVRSDDTKELIIEEGFKVRWEGIYKWYHLDGYKDPTAIGEGSNWNILTDSGEDSLLYSSNEIVTNTEISIELLAPKVGLTVDEHNNIVSAEGDYDKTKDMAEVKFKNLVYYGTCLTDTPDEADIKSLISKLSDNRETLINDVSCNEEEYYCYAYPAKLGDLKYIKQDDGFQVTGAFTKSNMTITNDSGIEINLNVYISNNPGAFTNSSLEFK